MLWIKAFHIIAVICWFAMLFYLPRLFVYHAMSEDDISKDRFKIMERKLYRQIGTPSMTATIVLGSWLVALNGQYYLNSTWFWIKISLVTVLIAYHHYCGIIVNEFQNDRVTRSHIFFRWFNELPVLILVGVVLLVVLKQPS